MLSSPWHIKPSLLQPKRCWHLLVPSSSPLMALWALLFEERWSMPCLVIVTMRVAPWKTPSTWWPNYPREIICAYQLGRTGILPKEVKGMLKRSWSSQGFQGLLCLRSTLSHRMCSYISTPKTCEQPKGPLSASGRLASCWKNTYWRSWLWKGLGWLIGMDGKTIQSILNCIVQTFCRTLVAIINEEDQIISVLAGCPMGEDLDNIHQQMSDLLHDTSCHLKVVHQEWRGKTFSLSTRVSYRGGQTICVSQTNVVLADIHRGLEI